MKRMMIAGALALSLAACATTEGPGTTPSPTPVSQLRLADDKAMLGAEATFNAVLIAVNAAVDSGVLKGQNAATVKTRLEQAKFALDAARYAYRAGNAVQTASELAKFSGAVSAVRTILGK